MNVKKLPSRILILAPCYMAACARRASAESKLDSLHRLLTSTLDDSMRVGLKIQISRQQHRGNHDEQARIRAATAAVEYAAITDNAVLYARSTNSLGRLYRYHQYYAEALPLYKKAFDLVDDNR